jgi:TRAP-type mannitol/chloroaromatic compound transport system permease small subunit
MILWNCVCVCTAAHTLAASEHINHYYFYKRTERTKIVLMHVRIKTILLGARSGVRCHSRTIASDIY